MKLYPFFINTYINIIVTNNCDNTVANAAPFTPSGLTLPIPNIKIGSRTILTINPIVFTINGVLLLPDAVNIPVNCGFKNAHIIPNAILIK